MEVLPDRFLTNAAAVIVMTDQRNANDLIGVNRVPAGIRGLW